MYMTQNQPNYNKMNSVFISRISQRYTDEQIRIVFDYQKIGRVEHIDRNKNLTAIVYLDFYDTCLGQQIKKAVINDGHKMRIYPNFVDKTKTWVLTKNIKHNDTMSLKFVDVPETAFDNNFRETIDTLTQNYNLLARIQYDMMCEAGFPRTPSL